MRGRKREEGEAEGCRTRMRLEVMRSRCALKKDESMRAYNARSRVAGVDRYSSVQGGRVSKKPREPSEWIGRGVSCEVRRARGLTLVGGGEGEVRAQCIV